MTPADTARLLAHVQAYDRRTVGQSEIAAWHAAVGELAFADATAAVVEHFRRSHEWLMPVHVLDGVRALHLSRIEAAGPALYAGCDDLEGEQFLAQLRSNRERIMAGAEQLRITP